MSAMYEKLDATIVDQIKKSEYGLMFDSLENGPAGDEALRLERDVGGAAYVYLVDRLVEMQNQGFIRAMGGAWRAA